MPDKKMSDARFAEFCRSCAEEKLAENVLILDLNGASSVADYYVVATANSEPQLQAVCNFIERQVRETCKKRPLNAPGTSESGWMLLDFGSVLVHLMTPETRSKYDLEGLWGEKPDGKALARLQSAGN